MRREKPSPFHVPAYRHPDALRHPVFCDFGESRWQIDFAAHRAPSRLSLARKAVEHKQCELEKARQAIIKAKGPEKQAKAHAKVAKLERDAAEADAEMAWLSRRRGLRMTLFDGASIAARELLWQSKRFTADAALLAEKSANVGTAVGVPRVDRLGRAAARASTESPLEIRGLFDLKEWNGRLQAPRRQLDEIAHERDRLDLSDEERRRRVDRRISRINWLATFSARLQPVGPWLDFAEGLPEGFRYDWSRRRLFIDENRQRKGKAQLTLARLTGMRVLSADLGHRYAAACAVWETISATEMAQACASAGNSPPGSSEVYKVLQREGKRVIYRRIGADRLPDGAAHPAPWARLDRQFLIKLQGEEAPARKASAAEVARVEEFERSVGFVKDRERRGLGLRVDELMSDALRTARLALKRHGRRGRLAYHLTAAQVPTVGGGMRMLDDAGVVDLLVGAIADWYEMKTDPNCPDDWAKSQWDVHIAPLLPGADLPTHDEAIGGSARTRQRALLEERLRPAAESLAKRDRMALHVAWSTHWRASDGVPGKIEKPTGKCVAPGTGWHRQMSWLRGWILPRAAAAGPGALHVGGLSLTRIATVRSLYQLQKAFFTRITADGRQMEKDDDGSATAQPVTASVAFGHRALRTMERLRENRVKQLASRIAGGALGLGGHWREYQRVRYRSDGTQTLVRSRRWVWDRNARYLPCHAIVIENLTHYRPEETRTRRENRQLMSWAAAKVKQFLGEACQLNAIHLWEVPAAYTSRQDSRTGAPGMRCRDVRVADFVNPAGWLAKRLDNAEGCVKEYIASLRARWNEGSRTWRERRKDRHGAWIEIAWMLEPGGRWRRDGAPSAVAGQLHEPLPVRLLDRAGEIFVPATTNSPIAGGIQADLNAAANIGLRALLDPDWQGSWWYVACDPINHRPLAKSVGGSAAFDGVEALKPSSTDDGASKGKRRRIAKAASERPINLWRDVGSHPLGEGEWREYAAYHNLVQYRVIQVLRAQAGLDGPSQVISDKEDDPF